MLRNRIKSRLLYKYIVSYLLVFLVPFLIMSTIIYYHSVASLRQEIEQSNINKLEQVENLTNERMKELETLAARISYDPRLTPYMISHGYYSGEAIEELKKYKANSSIIEELFIYYHNDERIYSTNGSYSLEAFMKKKYRFVEWGKEDLISDLHTKIPFIKPINKVVINNEKYKNMIAYLFPISPNSHNPYGTVMYFIEESTMTDLIQNILGEYEGNVYIFNEHNQVIASSNNDRSISSKQLTSLPSDLFGVNNVELDGKEYSLVSVNSELSGWKFIALMDADQFFQRLDNTTILIFAILIALLIAGFILAVLLGKYQYKPIQNLFEITNRNGRKKVELEGGNELETIRKTITHVFEDQQILNETMYLQKPFARDQFLVKLLKGDLSKGDEIKALLSSLNVQMKDGHYFVAIVYFEKGAFVEDNLEEREKLFSSLSNISLANATAHGIDLFYNDAIALIVSMNKLEEEANIERRKLVLQIQRYIRETCNFDPTIGVGGFYDEKNLINRSYIEALATLEYKFAKPQGSVIYFEEISILPEQSLGYPIEEQMKLVQSLKQGDQIVAAETLRNMFSNLADKDLSIQVLKCICFDIINSIVKTTSEMGLSKYIRDFKAIADFHSIEQLHKQLHTLILTICKEVDDKKESHNDKLRNDILDYIRDNYNNYELSLESLALKFQLSVSYVSRFIKGQTGVTFTQYLQDLRMEDVKRQLKETDKSIKDIVVQVGYLDVANFTRKFKKVVGVTPGQYRNLNR
ncbi:helix-turn-helix domain-containing protein [Metabacillus bambusae]|uniref:Helix-turn-helix domain-containing protein n=1 Tax=Metabacillus bambusae TaxID=2795218 RepID=A0ABS3N3B4_9BACI|nr:helix-turn-helix domain-containing protein [Metabacillus bambusae]MBO1512760.1 helix-turn-helix domain-containing protein [Metabacillus bambusae]